MQTCPACGMQNPTEASFCMRCAAALGPAPRATRKLVTVLFCDIVGSTTLAEQHDPEVLRPLLERYFREMRSEVEFHGGQVEKFIGDAIAAVFGVPAAHEDDALRAVRAALAMQGRLQAAAAEGGLHLEARVGLSTGEVFVPGDGTPMLGDTMNTAARLQAAAAPGEILIGEATYRLVRGAVEVESIAPLSVKGKAEAVAAYRVVRIDTSSRATATPFVGRDRYLRVLTDAIDDAADARRAVLVTVLAPAGVGKSRLAEAFAAAVRDRATVLVGQTPAYGDGVTFAPLLDVLAHAAAAPGADAVTVAAGLRDRLAGQADGSSVADRLAQLLGLGDARGADPVWAVRRLLETMAAERPVVVILEDVHAAEPPMLDLADAVVERVQGPVLVLCLARPELLESRPTWGSGKARAMTVTLPPLSAEEARDVTRSLLGPDAPDAVVDQLGRVAEGNPLFLEQLSAVLADRGFLVDGRWVGPAAIELDVPSSLQALLAARLDRLDPVARLILEHASIEGRRFGTATVRALTPELATEAVDGALAALERSGLVQVEDEGGGRWRFAHALIVETAYRGIAKGTRADLHEHLADRIESGSAEVPDTDEVVARHLERAVHLREEIGRHDERTTLLAARAGRSFATAGRRAFAALDFLTARELLSRASLLLPDLDPSRLELLPNLGVALTETGRAEESELLLARAIDQAHAVGSEGIALRARVQLLANRVYRSPSPNEIDAAASEAIAAAGALESLGDRIGLAEADLAVEYLEYTRGRLDAQGTWTLRVIEHALATGQIRELSQGSADLIGSSVLGPLPFDRFGEPIGRLRALADEPIIESAAHALSAAAALATGDLPAFGTHERRLRELVDGNGLTWLGAACDLMLAIVEVWVGRAVPAEQRLRDARVAVIDLGDIWWTDSIDGALAAALDAQGRRQDFLQFADAFDAASHVGDRQNLIHRSTVRAQAMLLRGAAADAESAVRAAVEMAGTTDLLLDHAKALLVLGRVLDARGLESAADTARSDAARLVRQKAFPAAIAGLDPRGRPPTGA